MHCSRPANGRGSVGLYNPRLGPRARQAITCGDRPAPGDPVRRPPAAGSGPPVRPGRRWWQPPVRRSVRRPVLTRPAGPPRRHHLPRRLPAPCVSRAAAFFTANLGWPQNRFPRPRTATTGPSCAPALRRTPDPTTTSPTSDQAASGAEELSRLCLRRCAVSGVAILPVNGRVACTGMSGRY